MNAVEFVKKHGIESVKEAVNSTTEEETAAFESTDLDPIVSKKGTTIGFNVKVHQIKYEDVKQIVDAWELVDRFGGLFSAKVSLNKEGYTGGIECGDDLIDDDQLKKAINLVEQCL